MSEPFLSEIRMMSFGYPPRGWALCDGQLLPINQNQALFSLLGTTFGGDGRVNFALPDLRGRTPTHEGRGHTLGERGGEQAHTLNVAELPTHPHALKASSVVGNSVNPRTQAGGNVFAQEPGNVYSPTAPNPTSLNPGSVTNVGGSQAHMNTQPYLTVSFCIALQGIFPSPN
jgi:microcystin-dependent protein